MSINKIVILVVSFLIMAKGVEFILISKKIVKTEKKVNMEKFFIIGTIEFIIGFLIFIFFLLIL
ncbi:MAG: hypothetical protein FWG07_08900 [Treponema sp.]|nr:hypothetical protein [Treponema sp.]